MGSKTVQAKLWGQRPKDWADIQERVGRSDCDYVLHALSITSSTKLLDVGCGTGYFCKMACSKEAIVTGLDATPEFVEEAKKRVPDANFIVGEMEELPFDDEAFDVVCGFNSFQYAANTKYAFIEAKRVLKESGKLVIVIWGNKEECEAATYLKAVGSLLPQPAPGTPGPFALSENTLLERTVAEVGFKIIVNTDVAAIWDYPDTQTALKGLMSAGPVARAIENSGLEKVNETISTAIQPYIQLNGHVVYNNRFRIVIAEK